MHLCQGLEILVGPASPNLQTAMRMEHCSSADSQDPFTTGNYGIRTTSEVEWHVVVDPVNGLRLLAKVLAELGCPEGAYPAETKGIEDEKHMRAADGRLMLPRSTLQGKMEEKNATLRGRGADELIIEEVFGGRL